MHNWPQTSESLILRLNDQQDSAAWSQFLAIYRPVVLRMAVRHGLQFADADDLTQRVFISVARKVSDWEPRSSDTRFRNWLGRIARKRPLTLSRRIWNPSCALQVSASMKATSQ